LGDHRGSFGGKKTWTPGKNLPKFIAATFGIPLREQSEMLERISDSVADVVPLVRSKMSDLPEFKDTGKRMLLAWQEGINGLRDRRRAPGTAASRAQPADEGIEVVICGGWVPFLKQLARENATERTLFATRRELTATSCNSTCSRTFRAQTTTSL
jgi:hypothetical protein